MSTGHEFEHEGNIQLTWVEGELEWPLTRIQVSGRIHVRTEEIQLSGRIRGYSPQWLSNTLQGSMDIKSANVMIRIEDYTSPTDFEIQNETDLKTRRA